MADQAITALPKKTYSGSSKIAATDYLLGIDSAEGYQMLIQDLGEYIINRVTASLAGSNQTLAAAISALNSNAYLLTGGTKINAAFDFDSLSTPGNYYVDGSVAATHSPVTTNITGLIKVEHTVGHADEYLRQTYYPYRATDGYYTRVRNNNVWDSWVLQPTRAEVNALKNTLSPTLSGCGSNSAIHAVQIGTVVAVTAKIEYSGTSNMAISGLPNHNGDTQNGFVVTARDQTDGSIVRMWTNGGKNIMKYDNLTEGHMYGLSYTYITA